MIAANAWAEAIGATTGAEGSIAHPATIAHIRGAVMEAGFVSRGRITSGLKEAYRPLGTDEAKLREAVDGALRDLLSSGDIDEFTTAAGRGYAPTPPRRIDWGGDEVALLGGVDGGDARSRVRRVPPTENVAGAITVSLANELGRPAWRSALIDLGGADAPDGSAAVLFDLAATLAASGERYELDEPQAVAVLSGKGRFFGKAENTPDGRWERAGRDGCFPAVIKTGYANRRVVLSINGGAATLWQPPSGDLWRWLVVGATLAAGEPAVAYDAGSRRLDFLTPPPRQLERAALLAGTQVGPWSWTVEPSVSAVIERLIGPAR
jgi:hypothetical protein